MAAGDSTMTVTDHEHDQLHGFSHEALFYAGTPDFVAQIAAFIREGLASDEPALVMVTADKISLLRAELGAGAARVLFSDMAEAGRNPGRIISAWSDFAAEHLEQGRTLRGVGEPIWADRSPDEMVECQHHESLLNIAFGHADGFRLVCPYDTDALPSDVIEEARRSHPLILEGDRLVESRRYRGEDKIGAASDPLPPPRVASEDLGFQQTSLAAVRGFVSARAADAGLEADRVSDLVLAVNEAATNSVRHAGGQGVVRIWRGPTAIVCEVRDRGRIGELLAGRLRPASEGAGGHGLWMANQLCDLVQVRTRRSGTAVRMHMRLAA
jgi:anti-sigma regulatory factor (Ser/Thr protein kinase)